MAEDGYFREDERFELVGGEIVPMSPKGIRHEAIRGALALRLARRTPEDIFVISEPQFNLDDDTYLIPDILVHLSGYDPCGFCPAASRMSFTSMNRCRVSVGDGVKPK
jgi:hypothetical protein